MDVRVGPKESWASKSWHFWTVVLEETLESPLDCKEIKPVDPEINQSWIFIGRTDAEAEATVLWPPDAKNWLAGKTHDGKHWRQVKEQQRMKWLYGITNSMDMSLSISRSWWWTGKPGVLQPWGHKELETTEWLTELNPLLVVLFAIIFFLSEDCLFTLFIVFFAVQKLLSLIRSHLFIFVFLFHYSSISFIEYLAVIYVIECSAYVFL